MGLMFLSVNFFFFSSFCSRLHYILQHFHLYGYISNKKTFEVPSLQWLEFYLCHRHFLLSSHLIYDIHFRDQIHLPDHLLISDILQVSVDLTRNYFDVLVFRSDFHKIFDIFIWQMRTFHFIKWIFCLNYFSCVL